MTDEHTELLDLEYTRLKRMSLIDDICAQGAPKDLKDRSILLQALDGMDRVSLGKMKIKSDEGISNGQAAAAAILAALFTDARTRDIGKSEALEGTIKVLSDEVQPTAIIEGELAINPAVENYTAFMERTTPAAES